MLQQDPLPLELRRDLTEAIAALPPIYREVLILRDIDELATPEAADHLKISIDAVKSRLHRAPDDARASAGERLSGGGAVRRIPGSPNPFQDWPPLTSRRGQFGEEQMTEYQTRSDIQSVPTLLALAPAEGQKFMAFNAATEREDGAIPRKYRELIALGVALTTQCSYCIDVHTRHAREHGVTREEGGGGVCRGCGAGRWHAGTFVDGAAAV
jgi:AhpD family alkylhydroperoxidase